MLRKFAPPVDRIRNPSINNFLKRGLCKKISLVPYFGIFLVFCSKKKSIHMLVDSYHTKSENLALENWKNFNNLQIVWKNTLRDTVINHASVWTQQLTTTSIFITPVLQFQIRFKRITRITFKLLNLNAVWLIIRDLNCNTDTSTRLSKIVENMANDHFLIISILLWHGGCGTSIENNENERGLYVNPFIAVIILCFAS